jgi:hypothetical protein
MVKQVFPPEIIFAVENFDKDGKAGINMSKLGDL